MHRHLEKIILHKEQELTILRAALAIDPTLNIGRILSESSQPASTKKFSKALQKSTLAVIAEIKRRSPSMGVLASIADPVSLANNYVSGGASAISILTDEVFFGGQLTDLSQVRHALPDVPLLRKDFIIDPIQIAEAVLAGADAVLLVVAVLGNNTQYMLHEAARLGVEALVEVHTRAELDIALASGAEIIGINNRDLATFKIDTERAFELIKEIPEHIITVAESGILVASLAKQYHQVGFSAVLIGEALVKSANPAAFIQECRYASTINN